MLLGKKHFLVDTHLLCDNTLRSSPKLPIFLFIPSHVHHLDMSYVLSTFVSSPTPFTHCIYLMGWLGIGVLVFYFSLPWFLVTGSRSDLGYRVPCSLGSCELLDIRLGWDAFRHVCPYGCIYPIFPGPGVGTYNDTFTTTKFSKQGLE